VWDRARTGAAANTAWLNLRASKGLKPGARCAAARRAVLYRAHARKKTERYLYQLQSPAIDRLFFSRHGELPLPPPTSAHRKAGNVAISRATIRPSISALQAPTIAAADRGPACRLGHFAAEKRGIRHVSLPARRAAPSSRCGWPTSKGMMKCKERIWTVPRPACDAIHAARAAADGVIAVGTTWEASENRGLDGRRVSQRTRRGAVDAGRLGARAAKVSASRAPGGEHGMPFYRGCFFLSRYFHQQPGQGFPPVDAMVTNFQLPGPTAC